MRPSRLLDRPPLFALIAAPILIEIVPVRRAGLPLAADLAPAITGVPPFALLHDLALGRCLRILGFRCHPARRPDRGGPDGVLRCGFLLAGVNHTQPLRALLPRSAIFAAVVSVCLWPSVALRIGKAVFPLIYVLFVALPMAFVIGVLHTC